MGFAGYVAVCMQLYLQHNLQNLLLIEQYSAAGC
jgi:hypothetical protein